MPLSAPPRHSVSHGVSCHAACADCPPQHSADCPSHHSADCPSQHTTPILHPLKLSTLPCRVCPPCSAPPVLPPLFCPGSALAPANLPLSSCLLRCYSCLGWAAWAVRRAPWGPQVHSMVYTPSMAVLPLAAVALRPGHTIRAPLHPATPTGAPTRPPSASLAPVPKMQEAALILDNPQEAPLIAPHRPSSALGITLHCPACLCAGLLQKHEIQTSQAFQKACLTTCAYDTDEDCDDVCKACEPHGFL